MTQETKPETATDDTVAAEPAATLKRSTGMVLGKFYPPTLGHCYMVDFARHYVGHLTVIVATLSRETIPGEKRAAWMRELFPDTNVIHVTDENPQEPGDHANFWRIWQESIRRVMPSGPDYVFASEAYGSELARLLGATYVPVDHPRALRPIRASDVRTDPMAHWQWLPVPVRPYFVRRVCIIGPESTGKTTLADRLAKHYDTVMVGEFARSLIAVSGRRISDHLFPMILKGQAASEAALARQANRVLICDSDAYTTLLYRRLYFGDCPDYVRAETERERYDLYLLTTPDTPFVPDPQRNHPEQRHWFFENAVEWLTRRAANYVVVNGSWNERFSTATAAIDSLLKANTLPPL
jgi:HTH-type transcriptional repressor of NAD biosynthesis genes